MKQKSPLLFAAVLLAMVPAAPAHAQQQGGLGLSEHASQYSACMRLTRHDPAAAFESAMTWRDLGGGSPSRHCAATALLALGHIGEAAVELEKLAQQMTEGPGLKAGVLAQAAQAWALLQELPRANAALTSAIDLQPDNPSLYLERALVLGAAKNYWETVDDLNKTIELAPDMAIAYAYRATTYRFLDANDLADEDVVSAIALDPQLPEAYLERGMQRRLSGEDQAAREDWLKVIELADGFPIAETARRNIEKLELGN